MPSVAGSRWVLFCLRERWCERRGIGGRRGRTRGDRIRSLSVGGAHIGGMALAPGLDQSKVCVRGDRPILNIYL